jgi:uncharacterized protein (TIGR02246 family)
MQIVETETTQIDNILRELQAGWLAGDGTQFAAPFAEQARFVAFDGTTLIGRSEIARFHQSAFDGHLQATSLELHVQEVRRIASEVWLVFAKGGIKTTIGPAAKRTGESVQMFVMKSQAGRTTIEAFQNTRFRPVTDKYSAEVWSRFDELWNSRTS